MTSVEEQFHLLMESVTDYAIFFADQYGHITTWNAGAERILGWSAAESVGRNIGIVYPPEDRQSGVDEQERTTAAAEGRAMDERWHVRKDGSCFWGSGILTALKGEDGKLHGYCKIVRDQTQQHEQQETLIATAEKDQRIAQVLQRAMLVPIKQDQFPGMSVVTLHESAWGEAEVGGDFYDGFLLSDTLLALIVGDASGKGLLAAVRTTQIKDVLRAFLRSSDTADASATVARLNNYLCDSKRLDADEEEGFVCLSLVLLDTATGEATFVVAGAEPPLVLRAADGTEERVEATGLPLGIFPKQEYAARTLRLEAGDAVLLVTDGLTEARRGKDFLEFDGLAELAKKAILCDSVCDAAQEVLSGAKAFAGGKLHDDACLLIARRAPAARN